MPKAPLRILIVAVLCTLSLIGLVVRESMARASGTEVLLAMEAVDPRSLLSGHFVIVGLREELTEGGFPCSTQYADAEWLGLAPNGRTVAAAPVFSLVAESTSSRGAEGAPGSVAVRGVYTCAPPQPPTSDFAGAPGWIDLDLGINRFHINQTEAERIDQMLREQTSGEEQRIFAIVSIGEDGRARLKGLMIDGERLELNWL